MVSDYYLQFLLSLQASITHFFYTASIDLECFGNIARQLWWFKWMISIDFYWIFCTVDANASGRISILATHSDWSCWILITFVVFFVCFLYFSLGSFSFILEIFLYLSLKYTPASGELCLLHKTWRHSVSFFLVLFFIEQSGKNNIVYFLMQEAFFLGCFETLPSIFYL